MPRAGEEIVNPVTGERIVFRLTAADTGGELLELDDHWARPDHRVAEHVHPGMRERWEVVTGAATFRIGGVESTIGEGEAIVAAPGTPHMAWNPTDGPVHLRIQMRPALRWEDFVVALFALAAQGRTDDRGVPDPAAAAELARDFPREIAASPPRG